MAKEIAFGLSVDDRVHVTFTNDGKVDNILKTPYQCIEDMLYHGHRKVANNTYLALVENINYPNHECVDMELHDHLVARFYLDHLELYSAGWRTTTTKNRLNLALRLAGIHGGIYQKDWTWYYGHYQKDDTEFKEGMKFRYKGMEG